MLYLIVLVTFTIVISSGVCYVRFLGFTPTYIHQQILVQKLFD